MGDINPSKMPGKKVITRKDNPNEVDMYAEGGVIDPETGFVGNAGVTQLDDQMLMQRYQQAKSSGAASRAQALQKELENRQGRRQKMKAGVYAEGGKVNAAGNYTKPSLRKKIVSQVKAAATHGTGAGKWSARKAQLVAKKYKEKGGGYRD
jgi:hypothetical protein